jgi:hypothetical protein
MAPDLVPPEPASNAKPKPASAPAGGEQRRLDRAPGERYAAAAPQGASPTAPVADAPSTRWIVAAVVVASLGGLAFFVLGLLDLGFGLVAVAGFTGWATAVALVYKGRDAAIPGAETRMVTAAFLGGWSVVLGMLLDWLFGLTQGGVMDLLPYIAERYWLVAPAALVAGAFVAAYRAR